MMKITYNPSSNYKLPQTPRNWQNPFKTGLKMVAQEAEIPLIPENSKIFEPAKSFYGKICEGITKNFTAPMFRNKGLQKLAGKLSKNKLIYTHMMAVGSIITSGMYMTKTLQNKNLDKDRKKTLAINQGLTLTLSTVGTYLIESALGKWWTGVTDRYVWNQFKDEKLQKVYDRYSKSAKDAIKKGKLDSKKLITAEKYLERKNPTLHNNLANSIQGMGLLKTMIIFGLIYRYVVPVAVTPIANKIGDKMVEKKKAKAAAANQNQPV